MHWTPPTGAPFSGRANAACSGSSSHVTIRPSGGSAAAIDSDEYPEYVPSSSTRRAPLAHTSISRNRPSIVPVSIAGERSDSRVSSASRAMNGGGGVV